MAHSVWFCFKPAVELWEAEPGPVSMSSDQAPVLLRPPKKMPWREPARVTCVVVPWPVPLSEDPAAVNMTGPTSSPWALRQVQGLTDGSADTLMTWTPATLLCPLPPFCWIQFLVISSHPHPFLVVLIHSHVFNYYSLLIPKAPSATAFPAPDLGSTTPDVHVH